MTRTHAHTANDDTGANRQSPAWQPQPSRTTTSGPKPCVRDAVYCLWRASALFASRSAPSVLSALHNAKTDNAVYCACPQTLGTHTTRCAPKAIADTVVAREIGGRLRRANDVVCWNAQGNGRDRHRHNLRACNKVKPRLPTTKRLVRTAGTDNTEAERTLTSEPPHTVVPHGDGLVRQLRNCKLRWHSNT